MPVHPEGGDEGGFEPTIGEELRLAQFLKGLDQANEDELRTIAKQMAQQILVVYPSAMRWLAREAARNLSGQFWSEQHSRDLLRAVSGGKEVDNTPDQAF